MLANFVRRAFSAKSLNAARSLHASNPLFGQLDSALRSRIQKMVDANDIVLFMKGTPEQPMCGFSRNAKMV
jgi:monothiol glutaredoxin